MPNRKGVLLWGDAVDVYERVGSLSSSLISASSLDVGLGTRKVLVGNSLCISWYAEEEARLSGAWSAFSLGCNASLSVIVSVVEMFVTVQNESTNL